MAKKLKRFQVTVSVEARGWQAFEFEAGSIEEALAMAKAGLSGADAEFVREEFEVQDLDWESVGPGDVEEIE